jgi:tagaturonate reductase
MVDHTSPRPTLSRALLRSSGARSGVVDFPSEAMLDLPERVIQFGTGAFLRGFTDYFIDEANRRGAFGGRIVMVSSTASGRDRRLTEQNGLYTLVVQGIVDGRARRDYRIISSVSRALGATTEWPAVLKVAESPDIELIVSNTTEVGIVLDEGDADAGPDRSPPSSFPAKLAALLLHRARHFSYDVARAPAVVPCELIDNNGSTLRGLVMALAERWKTEPEFVRWLERVPFCNTLVDRIVAGAPRHELAAELGEALGYDDAMLTIGEPYRLLAIEGNEALRDRLRFVDGDPEIVVTEDITPYQERKIFLLNGTHTALVSIALLSGCTTVREAMEHPALSAFARTALLDEIVPSVRVPGAEAFARDVLDRFANPYLQHALWDITLQGTAKFRGRLVPTIVAYARRAGHAPRALALGFAGYLALQRGDLQAARAAEGRTVPADGAGDTVRARWSGVEDNAAQLGAFVRAVCADEKLWGIDLNAVPGFAELTTEHLVRIRQDGAVAALATLLGATA